ncbi:MAG: flavin reductase [Clostridia bacterium]|nr:flavin reductase [Clostridia bacterium]
MSNFKEIDIATLDGNFFTKIGKEWTLITAGSKDKLNTMTASWGGVGVLWNKNVVFSFIRQSRYTLEFIDNNDYYTLSFFGGHKMEELIFCGRNSGRDVDKIKETGLIPVFDERAPFFEQAELVLICKKLYKQTMTSDSFIDKSLAEQNYSDNDWHEVFVGEIVKAVVKV